jgi:hypothetical protein
MFRFFRHLRKNLIQNGQIRRYALYAVGEIALVVIGILLALQIDAWNEEQKLKKKEVVYLKEIRMNLQEDLEDVADAMVMNRRKDSIITSCLMVILETTSEREAMEVILQSMPNLASFSLFSRNRVAFDNMLSGENIDVISNDSLRNGLSSYYSQQVLNYGTQERAKELTRQFVDDITPLLMNQESIRGVYGVANDFKSAENINFRTNPMIFGDLFGMQRNLESHTAYLEYYNAQIKALIAQIDGFLKQTE